MNHSLTGSRLTSLIIWKGPISLDIRTTPIWTSRNWNSQKMIPSTLMARIRFIKIPIQIIKLAPYISVPSVKGWGWYARIRIIKLMTSVRTVQDQKMPLKPIRTILLASIKGFNRNGKIYRIHKKKYWRDSLINH